MGAPDQDRRAEAVARRICNDPSGRQPLILVATPCFGGLVHHGYMLSICKLMDRAADEGFSIELAIMAGDALITRARSVLVARFLDQSEATHLLFVDADVAFEPEQVTRMLRFDRDFVAALYPIKSVDWAAVPRRVVDGETLASAGLTYVGSPLEPSQACVEDGFAKARYAGTGLQLLRREVLDRLVAAHPELRFKSVHTLAGAIPQSENLYALFDPHIDADTGEYLSEDYAFCRRWRALGGDIWLDLRSKVTHIGTDHFTGDAAVRFRALDKPAAPGESSN